MIVEIRHHDVVVEVVPVHPHQVQETDVVVGVAVHNDRGTLRFGRIGGGGIDPVELVTVLADQ